jgi:hypothetical protein
MSVFILDYKKKDNLARSISLIDCLWLRVSIFDTNTSGNLALYDLKIFLQELYKMNQYTYCKKYREVMEFKDEYIEQEIYTKPQALKTLQCLHYNIEVEYLKDYVISDKFIKNFKYPKIEYHIEINVEFIITVLESLIAGVSSVIINDLTAYRVAEWG